MRLAIVRCLAPDGFIDRPVDSYVLFDGAYQLPGDQTRLGVAEDFDRAVVGLRGIVEHELIVGKPEVFTRLLGYRSA